MFRELVNRVRAIANWQGMGVANNDVWSSVCCTFSGLLAEKSALAGRRIVSFTELGPFFFWLACLGLLGFAAVPTHAADNFTPTSAFTDNRDGTVTHQLTGLTWMRCSMGQTWTGSTCDGTASSYSFNQAKGLSANFAGATDWRLPSPWELATIVDYDIADPGPTINSTMFPNTQSWHFWSGSPSANTSSFAWGVFFGPGAALNPFRSTSGHVRLVRGGQSFGTLTTPSSDFTDNGDGTVTHKQTQLIWKRCAEGQTWTGSTCTGTASPYTYDQAITLTASFAGKTDWRTPNIQELQSIVEYGAYNPSINLTIFSNTPSSYFWSGSPYAGGSDYAWSVSFKYGLAIGYLRSIYNSVRLVRGGQSFAPLTSASDCLLNWAEDNYPTLFVPSRPASQTFGSYILRTYSQTGTYLALSADPNGRVYYYQPSAGSNALLDLGLISTWKTQAGCAQ